MSIRTCAWPECQSRFPTDQGPTTDGWKIFSSPSARVMLCPFHSDAEHAPHVSRLRPETFPVRFCCSCREWQGVLVDSMVSGLMAWQAHVRHVLYQTS